MVWNAIQWLRGREKKKREGRFHGGKKNRDISRSFHKSQKGKGKERKRDSLPSLGKKERERCLCFDRGGFFSRKLLPGKEG